jgi:hypothetical protein
LPREHLDFDAADWVFERAARLGCDGIVWMLASHDFDCPM